MRSVNFVDMEGDDDIIPLTFINNKMDLQFDPTTNFIGGYDTLTVGNKSNKLIDTKGPYNCRLSEYAKDCMNNKILKFQFVLCKIRLELPGWGSENNGWICGITKNQPLYQQPGYWNPELGRMDVPGVNSNQSSSVTHFDITEPFDNLYFIIKKNRNNEVMDYPMLIIDQVFSSGYTGLLIPKWGDWS